MSGLLFIISAPSGSGKSTLVNGLRTYVPNLEFSVSYTTRPPRGSEEDGHEYHFISREQFEGMIMRDEFLEYALVFGNYYGTAKRIIEEAERQDHDVILDIDVQGAQQVKERLPNAISIFVLPPSRAELESRLRKRSLSEHVPPQEIQRRLDEARREIENYPKYDYILVNDRVEPSVDKLVAIVQAERAGRSGKNLSPQEKQYLENSEKCLKPRMEKQIKSILDSFDVSTPTALPGREVTGR
jgi:guanylate kinase